MAKRPSSTTSVTEAGALHSGCDPQAALLDWYATHQRDLPWRRDPSPYRVLVSEVMLQQTQVDRVVSYFERFLERFPALADLAAASRSAVIDVWAGLGYNRRAVYLHELARIVVERHGGDLPRDRAALLALPGIGRYTAGAILSIGFGEDSPALDTNVRRVLGRYAFGDSCSDAELAGLAEALVPTGRAGEWNQALMDLGATICSARTPRCLICPLRQGCASAGQAFAPLPRGEADQGPTRRTAGRVRAGTRATSQRPTPLPFEGPARYYRGRLLAALRSLSPGEQTSLYTIADRLAAQGVAEPMAGWEVIGRSLERDGLAAIRDTPEGPAVGLPD